MGKTNVRASTYIFRLFRYAVSLAQVVSRGSSQTPVGKKPIGKSVGKQRCMTLMPKREFGHWFTFQVPIILLVQLMMIPADLPGRLWEELTGQNVGTVQGVFSLDDR